MTNVQAIGVLVVRLVGLYFVITTLPVVGVYGAEYFGLFEGADDPQDVLPVLIFQSVILAVALLAVFLARPIGRLAAPPAGQTAQSSPIGPEEMVSIGSFLMGVLLILYHLPQIVTTVFQAAHFYMQNLDERVPWNLWLNAFGVWEKLLVLLIAFWLILRPTHLAGFYRWLRSAGQVPPRSGQDDRSEH